MIDTVEISWDVFEHEKDALRSLVLDQAASKVCHFDCRIREMHAKYRMSFEEFRMRIESRKGTESFDEWDDFIIWESYEPARRYWANVEARLKGSKA